MIRRLRNTITAVRRSGFNLPALLIALWFLACATSLFQPKTPEGVQCPTAPVQTVLRQVKDKCGCIIAVRADAPKPGDKAFVQCRCAEKKSSTLVASTAPKFELMQPDVPVLDLPARLVVLEHHRTGEPFDPSVSIAPPTLPPGLA